MATTVTISIQGSKAVEVKSTDTQSRIVAYPGQTILRTIHGETMLSLRETGQFLGSGSLVWVPTKS